MIPMVTASTILCPNFPLPQQENSWLDRIDVECSLSTHLWMSGEIGSIHDDPSYQTPPRGNIAGSLELEQIIMLCVSYAQEEYEPKKKK
ncbi:hypothetical protein AVEN_135589-1 [Araneus ventricosus]|uniref:Uncharacterized protein n=1 Tax=Araneus ventricosus TaxID=182803 RepID=A0A4Y2V8T7_ARAVE|nr:hypothetical protein AVEN_135589-1 [Araneus ventricosus]